MTMPTEDTLTSKLTHCVVILLVVAYVVFGKKSSRVVESVYPSAKISHAATYGTGSNLDHFTES